MEFKVIPNEQTPPVDVIQHELVGEYIEKHKDKLLAFLEYARDRDDAVGLAANQTTLDGERFGLRAFALRNMVLGTWSLIINPEILDNLGLVDTKVELSKMITCGQCKHNKPFTLAFNNGTKKHTRFCDYNQHYVENNSIQLTCWFNKKHLLKDTWKNRWKLRLRKD